MNDWPSQQYRCIVIDPPWPHPTVGRFKRHKSSAGLLYKTMSLAEVGALPVGDIAEPAAHLWLWTTNRFICEAHKVMRRWGFTYLTMITWIKPSGFGAWFVSTTQHCLFGYKGCCVFPGERYKPTHFAANPGEHSQKPEAFYRLVREISPPPRIDLFSRREIWGFDGWGDESSKQLPLFAQA